MKRTNLLQIMIVASLGCSSAVFAAKDGSYVYTMSNDPQANSIIVFKRANDGTLDKIGSFDTGGKGINGDVDEQHSLIVSDHLLFAANPGSNDISVFAKNRGRLKKVGQYSSGGKNPVSLSISGKDLIVANQAIDGGTPNLTAFHIDSKGALKMMAGVTSEFKAGAGPADVDFSPNGKMLAVTYGFQAEESAMVATFKVDNGQLTKVSEAAAYGPVGLSWNPQSNGIYVSTFRKASVLYFNVDESGKLGEAKKVTDGEAAACWTCVNKAGDRLYVANFVSNSISIYSLDALGQPTFITSIKRPTITSNDTKDLVLSEDGKFLYVLGTTSKRIDTFLITESGLEFVASTKSMMGSGNWKGLAQD